MLHLEDDLGAEGRKEGGSPAGTMHLNAEGMLLQVVVQIRLSTLLRSWTMNRALDTL